MNKVVMDNIGRNQKTRTDALGRAIRDEIPVSNSDRDSSMDDVMNKLSRID